MQQTAAPPEARTEKVPNWCDVGKAGKAGTDMNPRHYSFWAWGYDECPICARKLTVEAIE